MQQSKNQAERRRKKNPKKRQNHPKTPPNPKAWSPQRQKRWGSICSARLGRGPIHVTTLFRPQDGSPRPPLLSVFSSLTFQVSSHPAAAEGPSRGLGVPMCCHRGGRTPVAEKEDAEGVVLRRLGALRGLLLRRRIRLRGSPAAFPGRSPPGWRLPEILLLPAVSGQQFQK